jgi:hypothetical protein
LQQAQLEKEDVVLNQEKVVKEKEGDSSAREQLKWGTNARARQRKVQEELMKEREDSDEELEQFLDELQD